MLSLAMQLACSASGNLPVMMLARATPLAEFVSLPMLPAALDQVGRLPSTQQSLACVASLV
jgi:hypothetical protein